MREPSLVSVVNERSDVELAAVFERIWEARGYETRVRFSGPDVHVEAEGETPEGAHREVRIWITTSRTITADMTSAFVRKCDRSDVEPYIAPIGRGKMNPDAHRTGLVELDASSIAVEIREADIEPFVRDLAESDETHVKTNWLGERVDEEDREGDGDGDGDGDDDDEPEAISRREALKKVGGYVTGGLVTYLVVERISDMIQNSPKLRAAIAERVAWVGSFLPDVSLPTVEWSVPSPQPIRDDPSMPDTNASAQTTPTNATAVPYDDLRDDPEGYEGTAVTYSGTIDETTERDDERFAVIAVEGANGLPKGDIVGRWPSGQFFDDDIGFRLLGDERVTVWGRVAGTSSMFFGRPLPLVDLVALQKA
ncbi:hypothetical protein KU306_01775 [Haloferax larsenii]|uniref:Restriction endonuclease n=1 Tax=Haloferax larsenii TaxID=302484 RepID=A0ABY5RGH8_HALLR|nr:hypothetical protein [Haloferax larsenii]UVE50655.1 hypothetical protein KU306_01775 [Haloferax larsenii]